MGAAMGLRAHPVAPVSGLEKGQFRALYIGTQSATIIVLVHQ